MTLVLLILAVIWAAVLIPPALRSRAEGRPADSITAFHRQLAVLRRAGPRLGGRHSDWTPDGAMGSRHVSPLAAVTALPVAPSRPAAYSATSRSAMVRRNARRRRKDILLALLVAASTTLVLGAIPALRFLWVVHGAADVLLFGYVALLVRQRNLAAERDLKVRLLPTTRRGDARREVEGRWRDGEGG
ncbi:MAG: hypothetical protein ACRD2W_04170, partial [Acidimicrobiales bacterium]